MKKALVIGLNRYEGCDLYCCVEDATAISEQFEANGDGSPNFEVKKILGESTKTEMEKAIELLFADDADIALLYFSGHGFGENGGYLCTSDYNIDTRIGVSMNYILEKANNSRCKNKVIILDCCFAGIMGDVESLNNNSVLGEGVTIIAASQRWQSSMEDREIKHGIFTNLLIQGLRGSAADICGNITPASLYSFVDQSLGAWQQRPVFKTNISQFLPLRIIQPKVSRSILRKLSKYFKNSTDEYLLNPSFEYTNDPSIEHKIIKPYANPENVEIFKELQLFESVGLIEPVGAEHMYFAAMESKKCKLTALGLHYWRLAKDKRF